MQLASYLLYSLGYFGLLVYSGQPSRPLKRFFANMCSVQCYITDLYIYILDAVPPVHVSNHVATDKITTANGGTFTSSSASLVNQSR